MTDNKNENEDLIGNEEIHRSERDWLFMPTSFLIGAILLPILLIAIKILLHIEFISQYETRLIAFTGGLIGLVIGLLIKKSKRALLNRIDVMTAKEIESSAVIAEFEEVISTYKSEIEDINEYLHRAIEENEKVKQVLWESEERLANAVTNAPVALYMVDDKHRFSFIQGKVLDSLKVKPEDIIDKLVSEVFPDSVEIQKGLETALNGEIFEAEIQINNIWLEIHNMPQRNEADEIIGVIGVATEITKRKIAEEQREKLIDELQQAISKIKVLSGLVPICANCKKIRDDGGYWNQIEQYISEHSDAVFSHGICPDCARKLYPELYTDKESDEPEAKK